MPDAPAHSGSSLDLAFARGDADLRSIYDEHGPLVYAVCRKALGEAAAGDVTQDVFVSAWKAREQFDPARGGLRAWLVGIAKRKIVDQVRRERRHDVHRADASAFDRVDPVPSESIERVAARMTVAQALTTLAERPRHMITLAYVHGLSHQEIAEHTGVPLGTVKSDIRRGLSALRAFLEPNDE